MATKNRAARFKDFKNGVTMYKVSFGENTPTQITIKGRPYKSGTRGLPPKVDYLNTEFSYEDSLFLGDNGIASPGQPACQPPRLFMSRSAAVKGAVVVREFINKKFTDAQNDFPDFDDYGSEPTEEEYEANSLRLLKAEYENAEMKKMYVHDAAKLKKFESSQIPFRIITSADIIVYGAIIDSCTIRLDYTAYKATPFKTYPVSVSKYLRRHKNVWYDTENDSCMWLSKDFDGTNCEQLDAELQELLTKVEVPILEEAEEAVE